MSGGKFNYDQHRIKYIAEIIDDYIEKNGKPKTKQELSDDGYYRDPEWFEKYPEDLNHYKYPDEVIEKFKEAVAILRKAAIYAHRIDYLLSGDDGEEAFLKRLQEELEQLNK